mgnify:CR=1 FL=1
MDSKDALIEVCKLNKASYLWFDNCFFNLKKDLYKLNRLGLKKTEPILNKLGRCG